jgi:hypothetical protein
MSMATGCTRRNVNGVSAARCISFFPVMKATAVPAPAPIGPPIKAPCPPLMPRPHLLRRSSPSFVFCDFRRSSSMWPCVADKTCRPLRWTQEKLQSYSPHKSARRACIHHETFATGDPGGITVCLSMTIGSETVASK